MHPDVSRSAGLDKGQRAAVLRLAADIESRDAAPPLSDQALTRLDAQDVVHLTATAGDDLVGYAQLDGQSLEIVGEPAALGPLLEATLALQPDPLVWSHGVKSPLRSVLAGHGFDEVRTLHQLRRDLRGPLPDAAIPDGVAVRTFVVGQDEEAWVRLNAAAFATHPEQGAWTRADVLAREAEPWFDPTGFLLAERHGELVGFHWTKVHADGLGEVYVLGVDPAAQGLRLGAALLSAGLHLLADRGCPAVLLYVDDDNAPAMRLYTRAGFALYDTDVQWRRPAR